MLSERIEKAYQYIKTKVDRNFEIGLILGSGLGDFADTLEDKVVVSFKDIPDFPMSTVEGHVGAFVFGTHQGRSVIALQGRLHFYEGYKQNEVTLPVRIMKKFGVSRMIITNAAGGVNTEFAAGSLMMIEDHINFSGTNPLIGPNLGDFGTRFPDATNIYTKALREKLKTQASEQGIDLKEGIYLMYSGPNYETPAEIRFFRMAGADAVGMSTVPEALVCAHSGIEVIGISCITNAAAGIEKKALNHSEVLEVAEKVKSDFKKVLSLAIGIK